MKNSEKTAKSFENTGKIFVFLEREGVFKNGKAGEKRGF